MMTIDLSNTISLFPNLKPKILIIDDDESFCQLISRYVEMFSCEPDIATNRDSAIELLENSVLSGTPYSVVTIDMRLEEGDEVYKKFQGVELLQFIKVEHPLTGCLILSGESLSYDEILDLRDNYGMDYILAKDQFSPSKFSEALKRAYGRAQMTSKTTKPLAHFDGDFAKSLQNIDSRKLREIIDKAFNEEELRDLCFDFNVDYDSLPSTSKSGNSRELISFSQRHGRFLELVNTVYQIRPRSFS